MAQWEGNKVDSTIKVSGLVRNIAEQRRTNTDEAINNYSSIGTHDVVGINASKIPDVKNAIFNYKSAVRFAIDDANRGLAVFDGVLASEKITYAAKQYITKVDEFCENVLSQLDAFNDKLTDVYEAYEANARTIVNKIEADTSSFNVGDKYTQSR